MPRSGTTLVESIISLNEKVQDLGEINIFEKAYQESIKNDQEFIDIYDISGRRVESFENGKIFIVKTKQNTFKTIYVL